MVCSAEKEKDGKPHPAVYLHAAGLSHLSPLYCIAIEDSVNGVIACKAAKMKCIAVPSQYALQNPKFSIAELILPSLENFQQSAWNFLVDSGKSFLVAR